MKQLLLSGLGILMCTTMLAQKEGVEKPTAPDRNYNNQILQYNMDFPIGVNAEQFAHGLVDIPMTKDMAVRVERFYTKFGDQEQLSAGFAIKYFLNKELYLITGSEIQYDINTNNAGFPQRELMRTNFGMGYKSEGNLRIELGYKPMIGTPNSDVLENIISNRESTFFLKARF
ncbi:hypothetical protein KIM67_12585 [Flagellimonas sp. 389]|uniref:hypothetical protein n=1 Tax=Flagellimonas sp. 389 TaxID=2835862 RepID=UPI001BD62A19|nr:hypothetical protein [Flagellimonas sp. 389]MBS9463247.1 hypothetical protein [Flagellimonas sp. 389]